MWKCTHVQIIAKSPECRSFCHISGAVVQTKIVNIITVPLLLCNFPQCNLSSTSSAVPESIRKQSEVKAGDAWLQLGVLQKKAASHSGCPSGRCEKRGLTPRGTPLLRGSLTSASPARGYPALQPLLGTAQHCPALPLLWASLRDSWLVLERENWSLFGTSRLHRRSYKST